MLLIHVPCIHLLFCTSIFCRQYTCFLCMYFMYTCFFVQVFFIVNTHASYACISCTLAFLYKYFLSSIHMLLMHAFHVHLLFCASIFFFFFYRQYTCFLCMYFMYTCFFVQVFFIVNTHASYACISCTLAFLCKYFLSSIHMLLMHVFHVHLLFCASIFYCQYTCFLCTYFMYSDFCI
jgi:hypothetical protein